MPDPDRILCAAAADSRDEPTLGTASRVDRWVLLEAPGSWGSRALPGTRDIDDSVLRGLQERAAAVHARTLLIRRRADTLLGRGHRRVFLADSRVGHELLLTRVVKDDELAALPLPFAGDRAGWQTVDALVGVCTHGSHDVCCAVRGRPVADALTRSHPDVTWEISHIGGDRFAANALVLPGGHYLGRLTADSAPSVIDALLAGQRPDPYYRGRSCWPTPAQAAVTLVGTQLGVSALDGVQPGRVEVIGHKRWRVTLQVQETASRTVDVDVEQVQGPQVAQLTCHALDARPVPHWELLGLR